MKDNPTYSSGVSNYNNIDYVTIGTGWENHSAVGEGSAQLGANLRDKDITYPGYGGNNGKLWTVSFTPRYRVLAGRDEESYGEGGVDFYYDTFDIDGSVYKSDLTRATVAPWLGGKIQLDDTFSVSASGRYELAMNDADCTAGRLTAATKTPTDSPRKSVSTPDSMTPSTPISGSTSFTDTPQSTNVSAFGIGGRRISTPI